MNYSFLVSILAFFGAMQLINKFSMRPAAGAFVAVIIPFLFGLVMKIAFLYSHHTLMLNNLFSAATIVTVVCQFVFAVFVFRKFDEDDGYGTWFLWGVGGMIGTVLIVPALVNIVLRDLMY